MLVAVLANSMCSALEIDLTRNDAPREAGVLGLVAEPLLVDPSVSTVAPPGEATVVQAGLAAAQPSV
jgi:hypothetical protein